MRITGYVFVNFWAVASEFIDWMVTNTGGSQRTCIETAQRLCELKIICHVTDPKLGFRLGYFFYKLNPVTLPEIILSYFL